MGCHVGLVLGSDRALHLYVDGTDQGVIGTDVPDPCYFMFDLIGYCTKVLCSSFYTKRVLHRPLFPPRLLDLLLFALLLIFSSSLLSSLSSPLVSSTSSSLSSLSSPPLCSPPYLLLLFALLLIFSSSLLSSLSSPPPYPNIKRFKGTLI